MRESRHELNGVERIGTAARTRDAGDASKSGGRREGMMTRVGGRLVVAGAAWLLALGASHPTDAATEAELQSAVFRAKPAVVMIAVRIGARASVRCSDGTTTVVEPGAIGELGSGSI